MNDAIPTNETMVDVANKIWEIVQISAEHGNAVIDLIGDEAYAEVERLHTN